MKWHDLTASAGFAASGADPEISNLQYDSRKVEENSVFFCIRGEKSTVNALPRPVEKAPPPFLEEEIDGVGVPQLIVDDSRKALAKMAEAFYGFPHKKLKIIGVTGTNGKTTATHLIKHILDDYGKKTALMGTNHIIIGDEIIPATHTTGIAEISVTCARWVTGLEYLVM